MKSVELKSINQPHEVLFPFRFRDHMVKTKEFSKKWEVIPWYTKRDGVCYLNKFIKKYGDKDYKIVSKLLPGRKQAHVGHFMGHKGLYLCLKQTVYSIVKLGGNNDNNSGLGG